jgi:hypothetical protein
MASLWHTMLSPQHTPKHTIKPSRKSLNFLHASYHSCMELLESQLKSTTGKKPEDDVKRHVLQILLGVQDMAEKIKRIKDKEDLADFVDRVINRPQKPKLFQDAVAISDLVSGTKEALVKVREAERKRQEREAKRLGSKGSVTIINNYTVMGNQTISQTTNNQSVDVVQKGGSGSGNGDKKKRMTIPKSIRGQSWNRWIGAKHGLASCYCCRINEISKAQFECGHVTPDALGGLPTVDNLRPICLPCNRSMGTTDMRDFCRKYYREVLDIPYDAEGLLKSTCKK